MVVRSGPKQEAHKTIQCFALHPPLTFRFPCFHKHTPPSHAVLPAPSYLCISLKSMDKRIRASVPWMGMRGV